VKKAVDLTGWSSFTSVTLHDDMGIEVIKSTVALCTAQPGAVVETLYLVITSTRTLFYRISGKRDK